MFDLGGYKAKIEVDDSGLVKGLDNADKKIQDSHKKTSKFSGMMGKMAVGAVGGLVAAVGAFGVASVNAGKDFEAASNIIRQGTGATGDDLKDLEDSFKNVFKSVPQDAETVATAMADLNTRTGETGEGLEDLTKHYLDLSRISGESADQLIENGSRGFEAWGIGTEDQADKLDHLWKVAQETGASVGDLSAQMDKHGATMRLAGMEYEDAATLMGNLEAAGYDADKAMNTFSRAIGNIAESGKDPAEVLPQIVEEMQSMDDQAAISELAIDTFGKKAGPEMAEMIQSGAFSIEELQETLENSTETIDKAGEDTLTLGERFQMMKDNVTTALMPVGEMIFDLAEAVLPHLQEAIETVFGVFTSIVETFKGDADEMTGKADEAFGGIGEVISTTFENIKMVFDETIAILKDLWNMFGDDLITIGKQAFELLQEVFNSAIEIITTLWEIFGDDLLSFIGSTFDNIMTVLSGAFDIITGIFDTVLGVLTGDWGRAWEGIQSITEGVTKAIEGIINQAMTIIEGIVSAAMSLIESIFGGAWSAIQGAVESFVGAVRKSFENMRTRLSDIAGRTRDLVMRPFNNMKDRMTSLFEDIRSGTVTKFNKIRDAIIKPVQKARDRVVEIVDRIKDAFDFEWSLPKLKLPRVSMSTSRDNALGIPIPNFSVEWHRRGGIFDEPTIAGLVA